MNDSTSELLRRQSTLDPDGHAVTRELEEPGYRGQAVDRALLALGYGPVDISGLPGRLIVLEGTDGCGRSSQIALLHEWLENKGLAVVHSAQKTSRLAGDGIARAQEGHTLGRITTDLFYATDFADRLENQILPALRAGFVVLTDRYIYSMMARSLVRGADPAWLNDVYAFAPKPHLVLYLRIDLEHLTPRVLTGRGFDYWESGMDMLNEDDLYNAFTIYQTRLLKTFDDLAAAHNFHMIDANRDVYPIFNDLIHAVEAVVGRMEGAAL
jgi:dTMP kinase